MVDPTPWNLLHDGNVVEVTADPDVTTVWIVCAYLRASFPGGRGRFGFRLSGLRELSYRAHDAAWDDPEVTDPVELARIAPELDQATVRDGKLLVRAARDGCAPTTTRWRSCSTPARRSPSSSCAPPPGPTGTRGAPTRSPTCTRWCARR